MPPMVRPNKNTDTKAKPIIAPLPGGLRLTPHSCLAKSSWSCWFILKEPHSSMLPPIPWDRVIGLVGFLRLVGKFHVPRPQNLPLSPELRTLLLRRSPPNVVG